MKSLINRYFHAYLVVSISVGSASASVLDKGFGADSVGMGEAVVASPKSVGTLSYNPGALSLLKAPAFQTEFSRDLNELSDNSDIRRQGLAGAYPLPNDAGTVALMYQDFDTDAVFAEKAITIGYATHLNRWIGTHHGKWHVGISGKHLKREFGRTPYAGDALNDSGVASGTPDPVFASGTSKSATAFDIGTLWEPPSFPSTTFGLSVSNINRPSLSLSGSGDKIPSTVRLGAAHKFSWGLAAVETRKIQGLANGSDNEWAMGVERPVTLPSLGSFIPRAGYSQGGREYKNLSLGLGFAALGIRVDYAIVMPLGSADDFGQTHRLSLLFESKSPR